MSFQLRHRYSTTSCSDWDSTTTPEWSAWETVNLGCNATESDGNGEHIARSGSSLTVTEYTSEGCDGTKVTSTTDNPNPKVISSNECTQNVEYDFDCKAHTVKGILVVGLLALFAMSWSM